MENFGFKKRYICWKCRREAEGLSVEQFAKLMGLPVEIYEKAENGNYDEDTYRKICSGINYHNHNLSLEQYYKIRLTQAHKELKYTNSPEDIRHIYEHMNIHIVRWNKIRKSRGERPYKTYEI